MNNEKLSISNDHIITEIPRLGYYVPNFISEDEEKEIIKNVQSVPLPKWTHLSHRRLQNWGGVPHSKGMIAEEIPIWLKKYTERICLLNIFEENKLPNHVLINEYLPGQGIMVRVKPHSDGPLFHPIVTTVSCGSHTLLDFYPRLKTTELHQQNIEFSLMLETRSLFILGEDLYHNYLHSIGERKFDTIAECKIKNLKLCRDLYKEENRLERGTRISLTVRHVPKTSKLKLKIGR